MSDLLFEPVRAVARAGGGGDRHGGVFVWSARRGVRSPVVASGR